MRTTFYTATLKKMGTPVNQLDAFLPPDLTGIFGGVRFASTGEVGYDNPRTGFPANHQIIYKLDCYTGKVTGGANTNLLELVLSRK